MIVNEKIKKMETADFKAGYRDRMAGFYDKWYRYNHKDNGAEYDRGCQAATQDPKCSCEFNLIPCNTI